MVLFLFWIGSTGIAGRGSDSKYKQFILSTNGLYCIDWLPWQLCLSGTSFPSVASVCIIIVCTRAVVYIRGYKCGLSK